MAFKDFPEQEQGVELLQRSLERGRLAHAYLFTGHQLDQLEGLARTLAKTLNCLHPVKRGGVAVDCCDRCLNCQKIEHGNHADVFWVRPESKSRQIKIGQIVRRDDSPPRVLLDAVNLKPTESQYKIGVIVAADRMNEEAANAFLKTLEEPPPRSVLILLTTEPQRLLETILSRCLRLNFAGEGPQQLAPAQMEWLATFSEMAAADQKSLLGRYRLMDVLLRKLNEVKASIEETLDGALAVGEIRGRRRGAARQMGGGTQSGRRSRVSPAAGGFPAGPAMVAARCVGADARRRPKSKVRSPRSARSSGDHQHPLSTSDCWCFRRWREPGAWRRGFRPRRRWRICASSSSSSAGCTPTSRKPWPWRSGC